MLSDILKCISCSLPCGGRWCGIITTIKIGLDSLLHVILDVITFIFLFFFSQKKNNIIIYNEFPKM